MKTYFWDFFGPYGKQKAEHHIVHVKEFLQRSALEGCETGVVSHDEKRHSAWLKATPEAEAAVEKALKPPRSEPAK